MIQQMRRVGALIAVGAATLLAGCAPSVVGKWKGSLPVPMTGGSTTVPLTVEFKKDNTFEQTVNTPLGTLNASGTYTTEGQNLSASVSKILANGNDMTARIPAQVKQAMTPSGTFKVEGDKLILTGEKDSNQNVTLDRVKE